jgi:hypothetical protein
MVKPGDAVPRSDNRQRRRQITVRVTDHERETLARRAEQHGYDAVGEYLRDAGIGGHRTMKRDIGRAIGHLGKIGSNLNQIARVANTTGEIDPDEARTVLADVDEAVEILMNRAEGRGDDDSQGGQE